MKKKIPMKQDINCINFKGLLAYLRNNYGDTGVRQVLEGLVFNEYYLIADKYEPEKLTPVSEKHLTDPAYWVSNDFSMQLLANVKKVVPGPNPLFKAGENCITQELSKSALFAARIFGVKFLAKQAANLNAKFTRTKQVKLIESGANYFLFELKYRPGYKVSKDVCNWNRGIYTGIGKVTGLQDVACEEIKCVLDGSACCMFRVSWKRVKTLKRLIKWLLKKSIKDLLEDYENTVKDRDKLITHLKQSEERYRMLTTHSATGIFICREGVFLYANERLAQILGFPLEKIIGRKIREFVHPEDYSKVKDGMPVNPAGNPLELRALRKDGREAWLEVFSTTIEYKNRQAKMGNLIDISERKQAEEKQRKLEAQLRQAHKMEAVGTLAGGIAHDFNNLLQAVQGYVELLMLQKEEGEPGFREMQEITRAVRRGKDLTRQLLTLSRRVESNLRSIDMNDEVYNIKLLLGRIIPQNITIELRLQENLPTVKGDAVQIEQVLMNLAVNARDAMPRGGTLTISTTGAVLDEAFCTAHAEVNPGSYVLLTLSDTGEGMDEETQKHIFEPFYTTKEVGEGTGLGLAMVYGIVKNHGGYILCSSSSGKGTTFKIYFPASEKTDEPAPKEKTVEGGLAGSETVLIVDDEDYILEVGEEMLSIFGYRVFTVENCRKALEFYRQKKGNIDLVILDLILPGMGGRQCLKEFLKINPQAKIIFASGYSADSSAAELLEEGALGFVAKPFEIKELLKAIRRVLD